MTRLLQVIIAAVSAGLPALTVLVSLLINNQRLSDFEKRMDQRSEISRSEWISGSWSSAIC